MNIKIGIAIVLLSLSIPAWGFIPVFDAASFGKLVQQVTQMHEQFQLLKQSYLNAKQQLMEAKQLVATARGHYGLGHLLNTGDTLQLWSPSHRWQHLLYKQDNLVEYYKQHPNLSFDEYRRGASKNRAKSYRQRITINRAVTSDTHDSYKQLPAYLKRIKTLSEQIERADNVKQALDLNNRLLIELAYLQVQQLRMATLALHQRSGEVAAKLDQETWSSSFNQWHPFKVGGNTALFLHSHDPYPSNTGAINP